MLSCTRYLPNIDPPSVVRVSPWEFLHCHVGPWTIHACPATVEDDHWIGDLSILSHGRHGGQETPPPPGLYPSITTPWVTISLWKWSFLCHSWHYRIQWDRRDSSAVASSGGQFCAWTPIGMLKIFFKTIVSFIGGKGHGRKMEEICWFFFSENLFFSVQTGEILVPTFKTDICLYLLGWKDIVTN